MKRQHPPVEVVRRRCWVTDGPPLERIAAATIPLQKTKGEDAPSSPPHTPRRAGLKRIPRISNET
jgi:hypothetical protein